MTIQTNYASLAGPIDFPTIQDSDFKLFGSSKTPAAAALQGRSVTESTGESKERAFSERSTIKNILCGLSNVLLAVVLSPLTLAKGINNYVIQPCVNEIKSMLDDAQSDGRPRIVAKPASSDQPKIGALDRIAQGVGRGINEFTGYTPPENR